MCVHTHIHVTSSKFSYAMSDKLDMPKINITSSVEPLNSLKDLHEKKDNLKRLMLQVASMAKELQKVQSRVVEQEMLLANEVVHRQIVEKNSRIMERQLEELKNKCEKKNAQAHSSSVVAEQYLKELLIVRANLEVAEAHACSTSTCVAHAKCGRLEEEIRQKDLNLEEKRQCIFRVEEEAKTLRHELDKQIELQNKLEAEIEELEVELERSVAHTKCSKETEIRKILEALSTRDCEKLEARLLARDEEVLHLREEIELKSTQVKVQSEALQAHTSMQLKEEEDLKRKVCKLEIWLQESRSHARKLQKVIEQKDREVKHLRSQLWLVKGSQIASSKDKFWMWKTFKLPTFLSISFIVLVCLVRH